MKILITGASGFLGGRTTKAFAATGIEVVSTSRNPERKEELEEAGAVFVPGDLLDKEFCNSIVQGIDVIVHCAALSSPWGKYSSFYQANVTTTSNLLDAAKVWGVQKFVFISSPSVYFEMKDRWNVSEKDPVPETLINDYARTKLIAEELVLAGNNQYLKTIAIRPRAIYGAEDTVIFPRLLAAHRGGRLKYIGNADNVCDLTTVSNVIEAIKCCISPESEEAYGQVFNITNGEPVYFWRTLEVLFSELNIRPIRERISFRTALTAASVIEWVYRTFRLRGEPRLTKYNVGIMTYNFTMDISKAGNLLGYRPVQTNREGLEEFVQWYKTEMDGIKNSN